MSHWTLCFFCTNDPCEGFWKNKSFVRPPCWVTTRLSLSPHSSKRLQCVGQRCKALVVPGFNALVVPAGFNALICQHIAPLSTTPPTTKPSSLPLPLPKPLQLPSPSASLCCGLLLHQGLMTSSVSLLDSTHPTLVNSSHPTGLQHQTWDWHLPNIWSKRGRGIERKKSRWRKQSEANIQRDKDATIAITHRQRDNCKNRLPRSDHLDQMGMTWL